MPHPVQINRNLPSLSSVSRVLKINESNRAVLTEHNLLKLEARMTRALRILRTNLKFFDGGSRNLAKI